MNVGDRCERLCILAVWWEPFGCNFLQKKKKIENFLFFFRIFLFLCLHIGDYFDRLSGLRKKAIAKLWFPAQFVYINLAGIKAYCFYFRLFAGQNVTFYLIHHTKKPTGCRLLL